MGEPAATTRDKALALNRDPTTYGTIAEIGAGQEVARWLFHVGGAAGTVAKTISAYDMAVSDGLYGPTARYVSRARLESMLEHEYTELVARLGPGRGDHTAFFAFADTVSARSYRHPSDGRGWLGIRFQPRPLEPPSEVVLHATLRDLNTAAQQDALGALGVNLIHAVMTRHAAPALFIGLLLDDLSRARIEIDMIQFSGPAFASVDNRLMSLQLVEQNLTDAAVFLASGEVVHASDLLHKKPVLVERGSFRPITNLTLDLLERTRERFVEEPAVAGRAPVILMEMTLRGLTSDAGLDHADFLARADILGRLGLDVLISRFDRFYQLADYLAAATDGLIGLAVGLPALREIAEENYYQDLPGGVLESTGRLFKRSVKMYVYPTRDPASGRVESVETAAVPPPWHHVRDLLLEMGRIEPIRRYDERFLSVRPHDVLALIHAGDAGWERLVPPTVAEIIKAERLFGYTGA